MKMGRFMTIALDNFKDIDMHFRGSLWWMDDSFNKIKNEKTR
jgi:hypothetical protein